MLWGVLKWLGTLSPTMIWICRLGLISRPMGLGLHLQVDLIILDHAGASDQVQQPASLHLQVAAATVWFVAKSSGPADAPHNACRCVLPSGGAVEPDWPRTVDTLHPECKAALADMSRLPPYVPPSNTNLCR